MIMGFCKIGGKSVFDVQPQNASLPGEISTAATEKNRKNRKKIKNALDNNV